MGHGIALEFALRGFNVCLHSRSKKSLEKGLARIQNTLSKMEKMGMITDVEMKPALSRIRLSTILEKAVSNVDIVFESVYENLDIKQYVFQLLDLHCPQYSILASNTSTFLPSQLASKTNRPDKVIVTHYINPPYLVPLVEIVPSTYTSNKTIVATQSLLSSIGKRPIVLKREVPGFVASRLQAALLREALWLVENHVSSPKDIDAAIKDGLGRRWAVAGVLEVLELAGWDLMLGITSELFPHLDSTTQAPESLKQLVSLGRIGAKSGKGFYDWTPQSVDRLKQRIATALERIEQWHTDSLDPTSRF